MATITPAKYNPLTMAAPKAPVKLLPKKKVDFSSIAPKVGVIDPLAEAKVGTKATGSYNITPSIQKWAVAKSASDIWKTKEVFTAKKDTALQDLQADVSWWMPKEELRNFYPDIPESVVEDLYTDLQAGMPIEEAKKFYPEIYDMSKQAPVEKKWNVVSNVLWWALRSAVDLPQTISEMWLLDRPAEYLAWKIVWEDKLQSYKEKWGKPFSQVAKENVIWDTTSDVYQWTRVAWDVIQIGTSVAWALKSASKKWLKEGVLNILKESDTVWSKRAALSRWWLSTQWKLSKRWSGSKSIVKPSQRTLDATDEIVRSIKWASKEPQKLFTQVSEKISSIWSNLEWKLKTIWIKWSNMTTSNLKTKLADLSTEIKDISPTMWKRLQVLSKNITNAETADDFRKSLQQLDDLVPDSVKKWIDLSWKDQYIYDAWRAARSEGNDVLAKIADNIPDAEVKKAFKSMSNLYHAKWQITENIWRLTPKITWMKTKLARFAKNAALIWWWGYVAGKVWLWNSWSSFSKE